MRVFVFSILSVCLLVSSLGAGCAERAENSGQTGRTDILPYRLAAGDQIRIMVYNEPGMSMTLMVSQGGSVSFPFIGKVRLAGRTLTQIEENIEQRLKGDYLRDPMVSVTIEHYRQFYITGEVESPNGYEYQPDLTIEQAIALAGGLTDRADEDDIQIRHPGRQLLKDIPATYPVYPGDTIIIGKSFF
ncbi:Polysaccharide biosynthesis/export protein [Vibrio aerogenes CECT 7868]|uniref:Polysaccharide biosynthesis/export protein n=1 Tax=Vibrio aerogenes CECT 7868 TaxID=1216006 RepID=A0A1M5VTP0_9VIBR|nr:polysaccharide biosynthesis/export family protein [Vibrio aerogenes]SHH78364.1 Polysaccharide biosynthesis/export protein [Vibrio aerogenes CECT 7868]